MQRIAQRTFERVAGEPPVHLHVSDAGLMALRRLIMAF